MIGTKSRLILAFGIFPFLCALSQSGVGSMSRSANDISSSGTSQSACTTNVLQLRRSELELGGNFEMHTHRQLFQATNLHASEGPLQPFRNRSQLLRPNRRELLPHLQDCPFLTAEAVEARNPHVRIFEADLSWGGHHTYSTAELLSGIEDILDAH